MTLAVALKRTRGQPKQTVRCRCQPNRSSLESCWPIRRGPEEVTLHWPEASDDLTAAANLVYEVFQGSTQDEAMTAAGSGNPIASSVTGATEITLSSLAADTEYYFAVVARDEDGNRSPAPRTVQATTMDQAWTVTQAPIDLGELNTTVTENGLNNFTLSGTDAGALEAGDLILIDNTYGRTLKRVLTATPTSGDVTLTTESVSLSEVIGTGSLNTTAQLVAVDGFATQSLSMLAPVQQPDIRTHRDPGGHFQIREQVAHDQPIAAQADGSTDLSQDVKLTYSAEFQPELRVNARWNQSVASDVPEFFRATAKGTFTFDAQVDYAAMASAEYKVEKELFSRTFNFRYLIAGVPVVQEVEIKFMGELDFKAESPIKMTKKFTATKDVEYGFQWSRTQGFSPVSEEGFEKTDEFTLDGEATAKATIKVYPTISTTFYKAAKAKLTLEANVEVDAKANLLPPPAEITKFDAKLWVDAWADANLTILGKEIDSWTSDKYTLVEVPLHSMPEMSLDYRGDNLDTCGSRQVYLRLANGYNNDVDPTTVTWSVEPTGPTLDVSPSGLQATFSSTSAGTFTIKASSHGDGFLGVLGTRRTEKEIVVVDAPVDDCDPVNSDPAGADGVFGCDVNVPYGLTASPMPSRTMIAPGDVLGFEIPAYSPGPCYISYGLLQFDFNQPVASNTSHTSSDFKYLSSGVPNGNAGFTAATDTSMTGGPYAMNFTIQSGTASQNAQVATYGAEANNYSPTNYHVGQRDGTNGECQELSALPVHVVNVVAPRIGDGHDDPQEAFDLPINKGKRVSQHTRYQDDDWYQFTPTSEGGRGVPYDSELPYSPSCPIRIEADNFYSSLEIYGSLQDAEAGSGLLASGNPVVVEGAEGVTFYVRAIGPDYTNQDYVIEAITDCDEVFVGAFPVLTSTPSFSANTVDNNGSTIDLSLAFTDITYGIQVQWRTTAGDLGAGGYTSYTHLGTTSAVVAVDAQFSPVDQYVAYLTLYDEDFAETSRYVYDPAFSTTHYTLERSGPSGTYRQVTTIPLLIVDVVE